MSEELDVNSNPSEPKPPDTQVVVLQGGPRHLVTTRVPIDHDKLVLDLGNHQSAVYKRDGRDSIAGALFNYVPPETAAPE